MSSGHLILRIFKRLPRKTPSSSHPLSLRQNFSWTFAGNVVYAACQWGILIVLAKLGTPEMVGQFTLGLAVTAPVILLFNLQLRAIQATDANQQYCFGDYLGLRLITTVLAMFVIVGLVFVGGYRGETAIVILLVGLAKAIESISDIFYGLLQKYERMDRIAISMILKGILSIVALAGAVYLTHSVACGIASLSIAWLLILVTRDISSCKVVADLFTNKENNPVQGILTIYFCRDRESLTKLFWNALPLGFVMMLISINANIPRYFIEQSLGRRELGIFAAIASLQLVGTTLISALGQSASPRLAKYYTSSNVKGFQRLLFKLVSIGFLIGGAGIFFALTAGQHILAFLYQAEYAENSGLLTWIMLASAVAYVASFLGYGMTAAGYFRAQTPLFLAGTCLTTLTGFWLIPSKGLWGAAIVILIGAFIQLIGSLAVILHAIGKLNRQLRIQHDS